MILVFKIGGKNKKSGFKKFGDWEFKSIGKLGFKNENIKSQFHSNQNLIFR